jgi:hypothetical protein
MKKFLQINLDYAKLKLFRILMGNLIYIILKYNKIFIIILHIN